MLKSKFKLFLLIVFDTYQKNLEQNQAKVYQRKNTAVPFTKSHFFCKLVRSFKTLKHLSYKKYGNIFILFMKSNASVNVIFCFLIISFFSQLLYTELYLHAFSIKTFFLFSAMTSLYHFSLTLCKVYLSSQHKSVDFHLVTEFLRNLQPCSVNHKVSFQCATAQLFRTQIGNCLTF